MENRTDRRRGVALGEGDYQSAFDRLQESLYLYRQIDQKDELGWALIVLADAGLVRTSSPTTSPFSGFGGITWNELRSDAGVGIANRSGTFRLAAVWRTDKAEAARLVFRVEAAPAPEQATSLRPGLPLDVRLAEH